MSLNSFRNGMESIGRNSVGKWFLFVIGALLVFGLVGFGISYSGGFGGGGQQNSVAASGDDVIATVNGDPITRREFDTELDTFRRQMEQFGRAISVAETPLLDNTVLEQLINAKLQLQQAKAMKLTVSDSEIVAMRADMVTKFGLRQTLGLPANASISDVDAALAKAGSPPLIDTLPDDTIRQMILLGDPESGQPGKVQTAIGNTVMVNDDDARQFYTKYHTRHILIDNKSRTDVQAQAQAQQILAKAKAPGADFAALANQYSDDPGNKDPKTHLGVKGGDDGFIDESTQYVPEFKKAAFALKPGEVTPDPIVSPQYGYFIIKLDAVKSSLPADYEKNKDKYLADIKQQRAQAKYQDLMTSLKAAAKVDVKDPALAGDRAFAQASQQGSPGVSQPKYQEALADYQKALKTNPPALEKSAINAALGQIYQTLHQTPQAIAAFEASLASRDDPALEMTLGSLYQQNKDNVNAVAHFQKASLLAWNDQSAHLQLMMNFRQMGRADLAAKESDWLKQYMKAHPAAGGSGGPMMPPGVGAPQPAGAIHVTPPPKPVQ